MDIEIVITGIKWSLLSFYIPLLPIGLLKFFKSKKDRKKKGEGLPEPDLAEATIRDAGVKDIVTISGLTEDYDDVDFLIERMNRYESGSSKWYELMGRHKDKQVWIEWEDDDDLFVTATTKNKAMPLSALGVDEDRLAGMDEEQSRENFIEYQGVRFYYRKSMEVHYFKDNRGRGEGFYLWDFMNEGGSEVVSVEKWEGEPFEVFHGTVVPPYNINVYKHR